MSHRLFRLLPTVTLGLALQLLHSAPASSEQSLDASSFTREMAQQLNQSGIPNPADIVSPLTMHTKSADGTDVQISLDRIFLGCKTNPTLCGDLRNQFILGIRDKLKTRTAPLTAAALRAVTRPVDYLRNVPASAQPVRVNSTTLPDGLVALIFADEPRTMRSVTNEGLRQLGLNVAQASELALQNTSAELRPFRDSIKTLPSGDIGRLSGDAYESSRILLHSNWAEPSTRFHGHLLVSTPSAEELLYADGSVAQSISKLSELTHARYASAQRPVSPVVMEWHPDRWVVVAP